MGRHRSELHRARLAIALLVALIASAMPAGRGPAIAVEPAPPVARWAMDEAAGTAVGDSVGTHHGAMGGTMTGAADEWVAGVSGTALRFSAGDRVIVPDSTDFEASPLSISMWVRGPAAAGISILLAKGQEDCNSSYQLMKINSGLTLIWRYGSTGLSVSTRGLIWDNQWHHVAFSMQLSEQTVWVDGVKVATQRDWTGSIPYGYPNDTLTLGGLASCPSFGSYVGDIDDLRIHQRVLTTEELAVEVAPFATATTTALTPPQFTTIKRGEGFTLRAAVSPSPNGGEIQVQELVDDVWTPVATLPLEGDGTVQWTRTASQVAMGPHQYRFRFLGAGKYLPSDSNSVTITRVTIPTVTTLTADYAPSAPGWPVPLVARTPLLFGDVAWGTVDFYEIVNGSGVLRGSASIGSHLVRSIDPVNKIRAAILNVPGLANGSHTFYAVYRGELDYAQSTSSNLVHTIAKKATTLSLQPNLATIEQYRPLVVTVTLDPTATYPPPSTASATGTLVIRDTFEGRVRIRRSIPVGSSGVRLVLTGLEPGTHVISAIYSGDGTFQSSSAWYTQTVLPNQVHATGLGLTAAGFYPVPDGYQDSVGIKGTPSEPVNVSIAVKNASGVVVRTFNLGTRTSGYTHVWDGRNAAGAVVPAGTYTVTQTLTDAYQTKLTWNGTVAVSAKKLVTKSGSVTLYADQFTAKGALAPATVTTTTKYTRGMKLTGAVGGYAGVGYEFTLPSATVYNSMSFSVRGSGGGGTIGFHDWTLGAWSPGEAWVIDWFWPLKAVPTSLVWTSTPGDMALHRSGRTVQAIVLVESPQTYYVAQVKLAYTYQVLE